MTFLHKYINLDHKAFEIEINLIHNVPGASPQTKTLAIVVNNTQKHVLGGVINR
jgi:hypothetical protein